MAPYNHQPLTPTRILRAAEAATKLGVGRTRFYELLKQPDFPRAVILGTYARGYLEKELDQWIENLPRS